MSRQEIAQMFRLVSFLAIGLALSVFAALSHADTVASRVFGRWEKVTIQTINTPVPLLDYERIALGSVQPYRKTETVGCPIIEAGRHVGWSMNCTQGQGGLK